MFYNRRATETSESGPEGGLHQAAALAAATLFITAHRAVMNSGFTLRRKGLSTDAIIVFTIGTLTTCWTGAVILSGVFFDDRPCRQDWEQCVARMVFAPWILQVLFLFWLFAYVDEIRVLRQSRKPNTKLDAKPSDSNGDVNDVESGTTHHPAFQWAHIHINWKGPWNIWHMECSQGYLNWRGSIRTSYLILLYAVILMVVFPVSVFALKQELYTLGLLNIIGVVLFIVDAAGSNSYVQAPHKYTRDTLRVVLHTRHREGTTYVLPCLDRGFDAVWGPKIENENQALDEAIEAFQAEGSYGGGKTIRMEKVMANFNTASNLTKDDIGALARWLYTPSPINPMCKIACKRKENTHLLAFSVMSALWHAEYLVMMHTAYLDKDLASKTAKLRNIKSTGLNLDVSESQIGRQDGIEGYKDAVKYIYHLFGIFDEEKIDKDALSPTSPLPEESVVFGKVTFKTIEEYTAELWHKCLDEQESVFAAFCAFATYWSADIGDNPSEGRHQFPLQVHGRGGDIVTWHVIWRQAWYQAVIAQLTGMSPIITSAFLAGIFQ
ncbi:hypothetical protein BU26DRAFT_552188 [Trematosphaeria pertusa]|uniref:Uncharacterized protein n=1 Tax=Trematosphaeria pertusa TaxID=390896 RepID=A0A6A6IB34_9PLEO|nr:uncharacterized protein BU26DRAFT_552188 [Trematosphaeria pertusa]KAF2247449.1 hypothetical protein BU26DRAFT_552188 [Trematosphaeria pertusa]